MESCETGVKPVEKPNLSVNIRSQVNLPDRQNNIEDKQSDEPEQKSPEIQRTNLPPLNRPFKKKPGRVNSAQSLIARTKLKKSFEHANTTNFDKSDNSPLINGMPPRQQSDIPEDIKQDELSDIASQPSQKSFAGRRSVRLSLNGFAPQPQKQIGEDKNGPQQDFRQSQIDFIKANAEKLRQREARFLFQPI